MENLGLPGKDRKDTEALCNLVGVFEGMGRLHNS